jgi:hypothetical protein
MLRALTLSTLALTMSTLAACGDDGDSNGDGAGGGDEDYYTCTAETHVGSLEYRLTGATLTLTDTSGVPVMPVRQGNGTDLFDTWLVGGGMDAGFATRVLVTFKPDAVQVTVECSAEAGAAKGVAIVESDATYTDSTISILEEKKTVERF